MSRPIYIFDLDGTIALNGHRQHHLLKEKKDWDAFHAACHLDQPNHAVIHTMRMLIDQKAMLYIWSGRMANVLGKTRQWLATHEVPYNELRLRPVGDHSDDRELKMGYLNDLTNSERDRIVAVFDDRDKVVKMWRGLGLTCFQVAEGNF
jgi:hypothetical protein